MRIERATQAMSAGGKFFNRIWYEASPWCWLLLPLSWLFGALTALRRWLFRAGVFRVQGVGCPVIVVGNIAAGGTGKTPVTIWLAERLQASGLTPGIVSRGYGGRVGAEPLHVSATSDPAVVGDEPLLLARRNICPVAVHPDRVAAAAMLCESGCDVIIADDGLQHYRMERQFEIAVVDGTRGFGNGRLLPAGPLREPVARLQTVDRIMMQTRGHGHVPVAEFSAGNPHVTEFVMAVRAVHDLQGSETVALGDFAGKTVHALAAIGNPQGFFDLLKAHGIDVIPHAFADHEVLSRSDLEFNDERDVIMTEKDAVKCRNFAPDKSWYVAVDVMVDAEADMAWLDMLSDNLVRM